MSWRIDRSLVRAELDNRERGWVRGRLWLWDRPDPVLLELKGDFQPDIAGCLLSLRHPAPRPADMSGLAMLQEGTVGEMTASRKVRVLDVPVEEALRRRQRGEKVPEHLSNAVYLSWFSPSNGEVLIEGCDFQITVSPPAWQCDPESPAVEAAPDPTEEGITWIRDGEGRIMHPLVYRARELSFEVWKSCHDAGLIGEDGQPQAWELVHQTRSLSAKLAAALQTMPLSDFLDLKLLRDQLHQAQGFLAEALTAMEFLKNGDLLPDNLLASFRAELMHIRGGMLGLLDDDMELDS